MLCVCVCVRVCVCIHATKLYIDNSESSIISIRYLLQLCIQVDDLPTVILLSIFHYVHTYVRQYNCNSDLVSFQMWTSVLLTLITACKCASIKLDPSSVDAMMDIS